MASGDGLKLPTYATAGASGFDIQAAEDGSVSAGPVSKVPTGFAYEIPEGYELQIRPRSGLSLNHGLIIPNSPATIDADYRGELFVLLTQRPGAYMAYRYRRGDKIAQAVLVPIERAELEEADELSDTARGAGGFGSTGK